MQLMPGQQIPSPSELMGKVLIKNKKESHEKPTQAKKPSTTATDQTTTTAAPTQDPNTTSQDPTNAAPTTQENQGWPQAKSDSPKKKRPVWFYSLTLCLYVSPEGDAAVEDAEEQEETEEQDEEKMKTSDEVQCGCNDSLYIFH